MRKAKSTYLRTDDDADKKGEGGSKDFNGRVLYALNPHGTDSGRLASREHHFWCGINIQNQTTGTLVKQTYESDPGFFYGESDLEQAETRDTAYITGDKNLLLAISSDDDFHSLNASAFFGIPYDEIYDRIKHKTKNKPIRDVAKRVNHGANYNMGAQVLVDTMGEKAIYNAARLLGLGRGLSAKQIAQYLLDRFDKTYPTIRGEYQVWIIAQILTHRKLVGATGWTRYCFSNPKDNKQALNSYVAHAPQSLNAMILNLAYMKVFYDIAIHPDHQNNFKLLAQIHDSILFQYKDGHVYLAGMVKERMEIPVRVTDIKGIVRTLVVPAALKLGKLDGQRVLVPAKYWSETE
jgi:DNA polymerase I-like protein with 3'-5' exonuclease and polymerase domains